MNAILEELKITLPEEVEIRQVQRIKPARKPLKAKNELPQSKPFARHIVTRWKNPGHASQQPAPGKSRWKIKRPHA